MLFISFVLTYKKPDQSTVIDTSITYTGTIEGEFKTSPQRIVEFIPDYVSVPEGGVGWEIFSETKSIPYSFTNEEGREMKGVKPEFSETLEKLDGQTILMQGYMFPLDAEEGQSMFLFGPFPVSCPYHYHVGPALIIETHAKDKVQYNWEAINLEGRLELVPRDDNYNVFYRLHDVVMK